jgi:hypothetical protein
MAAPLEITDDASEEKIEPFRSLHIVLEDMSREAKEVPSNTFF